MSATFTSADEYFHSENGSEFHAFLNPCLTVVGTMRLEDKNQLNESNNIDIKLDSNKDLTIYPNPSSGFVKIITSRSNIDKIDIELSDEFGKIIRVYNGNKFSEQGFEIDLGSENLRNGIYCLNFKSDDFLSSARVVFIN